MRPLLHDPRAPAWPLSVFRTSAAIGAVLLLLCGVGSVTGWPFAMGATALIVGLTGCWCLVLIQLLTSPRGSGRREVALTAVGAGPPWLFAGMLLAQATSATGELVPEAALSPVLAWILTPALVGCLVVLAWRLLLVAPGDT